MVQKRTRRRGDVNLLAVAFDRETVERLLRRFGLTLGRAKRRKIVTPDQKLSGLVHGGGIQTRGNPPGTPAIECQIGPTIDDAVEVVAANGREARIKTGRHR